MTNNDKILDYYITEKFLIFCYNFNYNQFYKNQYVKKKMINIIYSNYLAFISLNLFIEFFF